MFDCWVYEPGTCIVIFFDLNGESGDAVFNARTLLDTYGEQTVPSLTSILLNAINTKRFFTTSTECSASPRLGWTAGDAEASDWNPKFISKKIKRKILFLSAKTPRFLLYKVYNYLYSRVLYRLSSLLLLQ